MADSDKPLQGSTLVVGTIALSLATFMNVLDTSIAAHRIVSMSRWMALLRAGGCGATQRAVRE